jgi:2'-hydroxyisoflavone reductase
VGPHDPTGRFTYWPQRIARGGAVLAPGRPQRPVQWIDVRDLAAWCVQLAQHRHAGVFDAMGPCHAMHDLLHACRQACLSTAACQWIGDEELLAAGFTAWTELPLWLPEDDPEHGGMLLGDARRAVSAGLVTRPIAQTVQDTLAWVMGEGAALQPTVATLDAGKEAQWLASRRTTA